MSLLINVASAKSGMQAFDLLAKALNNPKQNTTDNEIEYQDFLIKNKLKPLKGSDDYRLGDEDGRPFRNEKFAQDAIDRNGLTKTHKPFYNGGVYEINPNMQYYEWDALKKKYNNDISAKKESGQPIIRFLNGKFYKEKIEKLYEKEKPIKGDAFVDKDKVFWTVTNVQDVKSLGYKDSLLETIAEIVSSTGKKSQLQIKKRWYFELQKDI